jgi:isopentenyl-diphosphate delta-isomerase
MTESVILVDKHDNELGLMEKMEAHRKGALHRAFSVLLYNSKGEVLLQKRSSNKYHSAGLWTNTCCSHPKPAEKMEDAVMRRLKEEMGIDTKPVYTFKFLYKTILDNNLIEHELDHVYIGLFNNEPIINLHEVENWKFASMLEVKKDVQKNPKAYTHWFKLIVNHPELKLSSQE